MQYVNIFSTDLLPYQVWLQSSNKISKSGIFTPTYLIRQYLLANVYERLSTRPFLSAIEKRWIIFQLMKCVEDIHNLDLAHGDIKPDNVMVTSSNWIILTDFAYGVKPTVMPDDDPSDFQYYFDSMNRGRCYVAPERFYRRSLGHSTQETSSSITSTDSYVSSLGASHSLPDQHIRKFCKICYNLLNSLGSFTSDRSGPTLAQKNSSENKANHIFVECWWLELENRFSRSHHFSHYNYFIVAASPFCFPLRIHLLLSGQSTFLVTNPNTNKDEENEDGTHQPVDPVSGTKLTQAMDIFSLGCTIAEVTARPWYLGPDHNFHILSSQLMSDQSVSRSICSHICTFCCCCSHCLRRYT